MTTVKLDLLNQYKPATELTKRELFAAMILQGIWIHDGDHRFLPEQAKLACKQADALIAELAK